MLLERLLDSIEEIISVGFYGESIRGIREKRRQEKAEDERKREITRIREKEEETYEIKIIHTPIEFIKAAHVIMWERYERQREKEKEPSKYCS